MMGGEVLMVQRGKKAPFHPRLRLETTSYARSQWTCTMFHPLASVGLHSIRELPTVELAVAHYFSELKRCGHVPSPSRPGLSG